ncbi:MAG: thioredoxin family protein [Cyanobacteria bacterium]|nr:thioredoxin family protein [Cyanobacteriota bacterium]
MPNTAHTSPKPKHRLLCLLITAGALLLLPGIFSVATQAASIPALPSDLVAKPSKTSPKPKAILLDFYSPTCSTCQTMEPIIQKLSQELGKDLTVIMLDIDRPNTTRYQFTYQIEGTPTYVFYDKNHRPIGKMTDNIRGTTLIGLAYQAAGKLPRLEKLPPSLPQLPKHRLTLLQIFPAPCVAACSAIEKSGKAMSKTVIRHYGSKLTVNSLALDTLGNQKWVNSQTFLQHASARHAFPLYLLLDTHRQIITAYQASPVNHRQIQSDIENILEASAP